MGFSKTAPPSTYAHDVHSCVHSRRLPGSGARFGLPLPRTGPVPSSRFLTALTAFSVMHAAGLLHPAADHGVHRVRVPRSASRPHQDSLHDASPFEGFPSPAAFRSRRILPPHRSPSKDGAISGSFSAGRVRCVLLVLPREGARSSLGFLPRHHCVASPGRWSRRPEGRGVSRQGPSPIGERSFPGPPKRVLGRFRSSSRSLRPMDGVLRGDPRGASTASRRPAGAGSGVFQGLRSLLVPRGAGCSDRVL
jgi:hypothetical protein